MLEDIVDLRGELVCSVVLSVVVGLRFEHD